ncbi:MAG: fatty acid desaturase [Planctomycetaceae bacterium]
MSALITESPVERPPRNSSRRRPAEAAKPRVANPPAEERFFAPEMLRTEKWDTIVVVWMVLMHVGALAAPFFFSWSGLGLAIGLHWLTASIGICMGYHRYLAHRAFKLKSPAEFFVLLCGVLSGEGSPLRWAAVHRLHHQKSDHEGDPHSPLEGKWWSHLLWLFVRHSSRQEEALFRRFVPELADRPMLQFFDRNYGRILVVSGIALGVAGWLIGGWFMAASLLTWGLCLRMVVAYHSTWFVNSATHLWGYRNYQTRDESRNLWWVALVSYGEGWHNNHHAHPSVAPAGHRWWEIDMTWWAIKAFRAVGLATDVKEKVPHKVEG